MYIIKREMQLDAWQPVEFHYYSKDGTTDEVKEAKKFLTRIGAYLWLKRNYHKAECVFLQNVWFSLVKVR